MNRASVVHLLVVNEQKFFCEFFVCECVCCSVYYVCEQVSDQTLSSIYTKFGTHVLGNKI